MSGGDAVCLRILFFFYFLAQKELKEVLPFLEEAEKMYASVTLAKDAVLLRGEDE